MRDTPPPGKKKGKFAFKATAKIVLFIVFSAMFLSSGFYIASLIISYINSSLGTTHPTSIPWISNEAECEKFRRVWRDNKCWDYEHNPSF